MIDVEVNDKGEPKSVKIPEEYITYFDPKLEKIIKCSLCGAPLFGIINTHWSERKTKITANCPHCGDKSFQTHIDGEFLFGNTEYSVYGEVDIIRIQTVGKVIKECEAVIHPRKVKQYEG